MPFFKKCNKKNYLKTIENWTEKLHWIAQIDYLEIDSLTVFFISSKIEYVVFCCVDWFKSMCMRFVDLSEWY